MLGNLLSLNHHAGTFLVEVDIFSVFPYYGLEKKQYSLIVIATILI